MNYEEYKKKVDKLNSVEHHFAMCFYSILLSRGVDEDDISMGNCSISYRLNTITFSGASIFNMNGEPFISKCTAHLEHIIKHEVFYLMNEKELFLLADMFLKGDVVDYAASVFNEDNKTFKRFLRRRY